MKTVDEIATAVSRWILSENDEWRKMAYIMANTYPSAGPLRDYLKGLIQGGDTPGTRHLREELGENGLAVLDRTTLPWANIWSFVAADLCDRVGSELMPGEHAELRERLTEREAER